MSPVAGKASRASKLAQRLAASFLLALTVDACTDFAFQHKKAVGAGGSSGSGGSGGGSNSGGAPNGDGAGTSNAGGAAGMGLAGAAADGGAGLGGSAGSVAAGATGGGSAGASAAGNGGNPNCPPPGSAVSAELAGAGGESGALNDGASAWDNLALTPPMGWNSWNKFGGNINEALIRDTADAMVSSGMRDLGYQYINIDDTWQAVARDECGYITPDPARFPSGMKALADYVHARGLKLGIYSDRGTQTCGGRPGSYGYEAQDAYSYASWGVDYLKYDNCYIPPAHDNANAMRLDYTKMRDALHSAGRPIVFSICAWYFQAWMPGVGNLWRTTTDIKDGWADNMLILTDVNGGFLGRYADASYVTPGIAHFAGPGHWNDPDMLQVGNGGMSDIESRSHFSLWAMMAAPLIAGNDLRSMSQPIQDILLNADVIAVDQDALGKQGQPISASVTLEVWSKPLLGNDSYAVLLLNRTAAAADISVTWASLGMISNSATVRDLWAHTDLGSSPVSYTAQVPSHGVVMLKVVGE